MRFSSPRPLLDRPAAWMLLILASAAPLIWPAIPPLTDVPGHMGRYGVQLGLVGQGWYDFGWAWIGNLGVDLWVQAVAPLIGVEAAVKAIVALTPGLTALGLIMVAHQAHGRVPPTVLFALPLAYGFPFHFGFINFSLSMALALLGHALWMRLGDRQTLRAVLFVPIALIIWTAHIYGWALLCVLAFAHEVVRERHPLRLARTLWPLVLPAIAILITRSDGPPAFTGDWFNWPVKAQWLTMALRDRWAGFDKASIAIIVGIIIYGARHRQHAGLALASALLLVLYALLPRILLGSAYADMRLVPYLLAVAIVAIAPGLPRWIGIAAFAFFAGRTAATTASFALYDQRYTRELGAHAVIPQRARLLTLVGADCTDRWAKTRFDHLAGIALLRRGTFANDQWDLAGGQLLRVTNRDAAPFDRDPSQFVTGPVSCRRDWQPLSRALAAFPLGAFDYVWIIDAPDDAGADYAELVPVWRQGRSAVYRVRPTK